jgi:hypothetical protein
LIITVTIRLFVIAGSISQAIEAKLGFCHCEEAIADEAISFATKRLLRRAEYSTPRDDSGLK